MSTSCLIGTIAATSRLRRCSSAISVVKLLPAVSIGAVLPSAVGVTAFTSIALSVAVLSGIRLVAIVCIAVVILKGGNRLLGTVRIIFI